MKYTDEWTNEKCDKFDYLISVFSGITTGLIDIFFVGVPGKNILGKWTDSQVDKAVMNFSKMVGWNPKEGQENNIASAIGFLERKFPVNYDQAHTAAVNGAFNMSASNHHYKSLSHSPDVVGLFFSILDQFQGKSSFINDGQLIRIETEVQELTLYGENIPAKMFCGFCNWIGHIMSDLAGSSGGRGNMTGRGSGLSIPFMELFQFCDFGSLKVGENRNTLAKVMTKVFQEGYDFRHGATMAIPVLLNELIIRVLWVIKRRFYKKKDWKDCIPSKKHSDLRIMLIVSYSTFCLIDGFDAFIRSGGNVVSFILRINLIGWIRLVVLVFRELRIRYGSSVMNALKNFLTEVGSILTPNESKLIDEYYKEMNAFDERMDFLLAEYIKIVNQEYILVHSEIESTFDFQLNFSERFIHSQKLAEICGVENENIIKSEEDLDTFFLE